MAFDLNRGMEMRWHPTGMEIGMYVDKPGYYYSSHGTELPSEIAAEAGFPVKALAQERRKREMGAAALAEIAAQFAGDENKFEVVEEYEPFKLVDIGRDRFDVYDGENKLNPQPLPRAIAQGLFNKIAGVSAKESNTETGGGTADKNDPKSGDKADKKAAS